MRDYYPDNYFVSYCDVCGNDVDFCNCPECPICGEAGNLNCYKNHGMTMTEEQLETFNKYQLQKQEEQNTDNSADTLAEYIEPFDQLTNDEN